MRAARATGGRSRHPIVRADYASCATATGFRGKTARGSQSSCRPVTEMCVSPEQTRARVESAGLELERVADLHSYHYGAVFVGPG